MFKIVHCKTSDEDVIRILDNVEETSLSAVQEEEDEDEEEEEEEDDGDFEDDAIEEAEYVHPEMDEYLDEEDETDTTTLLKPRTQRPDRGCHKMYMYSQRD